MTSRKSIKRSQFTSYHDLNKKGDNRRIWLEGEPLLRAGFKPGDFFRVKLNMDTLAVTLEHIPDSSEARKAHARKEVRKVSRRNMGSWVKPIVDICNAEITQLFGDFSRFRAQAFAGEIVFSVHPEDLAQARREQRFKRNLEKGQITKGDAFLGFGISSHACKTGFASEGIKTKQLWAVEMEARYLDIATQNSPEDYQESHLFCGKVEEIEKSLLDEVDNFTFSMPCTNHSLQGRAKKKLASAEMGDEVTSLFGVVEMIKAANPALLISENVPEAKDSITYQLLKKEMERLGYSYKEMILDNKQAGCLEARRRYWLVGVSKGLSIVLESLVPTEREKVHASLGDVMEHDLEHKWYDIASLEKRTEINKANGRNFSINLVDAKSNKVSTIPRNYAKHQVSNPHIVSEDGSEYRLISRREHARVKGIPEHLANNCSATVAHEGLGQSILYAHAADIASSAIRAAMGKPEQLKLSVV
jgi:DNA (cytosine-5)-methyltransferase 1